MKEPPIDHARWSCSWRSMGARTGSIRTIVSGSRSGGCRPRQSTAWAAILPSRCDDPHGDRLLGFDNAHDPPATGCAARAEPEAADHRHRAQGDRGRPYRFRKRRQAACRFLRRGPSRALRTWHLGRGLGCLASLRRKGINHDPTQNPKVCATSKARCVLSPVARRRRLRMQLLPALTRWPSSCACSRRKIASSWPSFATESRSRSRNLPSGPAALPPPHPHPRQARGRRPRQDAGGQEEEGAGSGPSNPCG